MTKKLQQDEKIKRTLERVIKLTKECRNGGCPKCMFYQNSDRNRGCGQYQLRVTIEKLLEGKRIWSDRK